MRVIKQSYTIELNFKRLLNTANRNLNFKIYFKNKKTKTKTNAIRFKKCTRDHTKLKKKTNWQPARN